MSNFNIHCSATLLRFRVFRSCFTSLVPGVMCLFAAFSGCSVSVASLPASRLTSPAVAQSGDLSSEAIRDAANRVMQGHDFRSVRRRVLEDFDGPDVPDLGFLSGPLESMGNAVGDFFDWLFSGFTSNPGRGRAPAPATVPPATTTGGGGLDFSIGNIFLFLGFAFLIVVMIWIFSSVLKKSDPNRKLNMQGLLGDDEDITDLSTPPGELAASTYESRAIQMAQSGNYRAAIRELLIGSMSWIERAGFIRFRKGLTNRDYVRAIWRQAEKRQAYSVTALEFERIYFGRRDATRDTFENCLRNFQGSFREEETTTAAV